MPPGYSRRAPCCRENGPNGPNRPKLSVYLIDRNETEGIHATISHKFAHALVGPEHDHNAIWKTKASEIGARPGAALGPTCRKDAGKRAVLLAGGCHRHRKAKRLKGWHCREYRPAWGQAHLEDG